MSSALLIRVQVALWLVMYSLLLLYVGQKGTETDWSYAFKLTTIGVLMYLITVYANTHWLIPRYFHTRRYGWYIGLAVGLIGSLVAIRTGLENEFFAQRTPFHPFYGWNVAHLLYSGVTILLAFFVGFLLRIAFDYLTLRQQQARLEQQQQLAELNLLKAQVQPHFLFNTLNNIYALSVAGSPETSTMLAKLSDTIRYFVDEALQDRVPLSAELQFLQNYNQLEQIRLRYPFDFQMQIEKPDGDVLIPPMLLMPFVENVFKHGVDRIRSDNEAALWLKISQSQLQYRVQNRTTEQSAGPWRGLANLEKRLMLLYPGRFRLETRTEGDYFYAELTIHEP
jgi:hypothetical protein